MSHTNQKSNNFYENNFFFLEIIVLTAFILTCNLKDVIQIVKVVCKSCNVIVFLKK